MSYGSTPPPPPPPGAGAPPPADDSGSQPSPWGSGQPAGAPGYPAAPPPAAPGYPAAPPPAAPGYPGASMPPAPYSQPSGPGGELAQWPTRAIGYLIDIALYIPGYILYIIGAPKVDARGNVGSFGIAYFIGMLYILGIAIWNRWIKGSQGQTVGRKIAGVKLVNAQGQPLGTAMAFVRDLAHIIDGVICYIGYLFPLWDAKRQTIADKIMNTYVVTVPK